MFSSLKGKQQPHVYGSSHTDDGSQYHNLCLNSNDKCSYLSPVQSNNKSYNDNCRDATESENCEEKKKQQSLNFSSEASNFVTLNDEVGERKAKKHCNKISSSATSINNSTLSLHISAYENFGETTNDSDDTEKENLEKAKCHLMKKLETSKQQFCGSSLKIQNTFEFPRQQGSEATTPEVMQFKTQQKVADPNNTEMPKEKMDTEKTQSTQSARSAPSSILSKESHSKNLISERKELRSSRSSILSSSEYASFGSLCFAPTLFGLIALGFGHYLLCLMLADFPRIHGFLQFCLGYFAWEWLDLFGSRLTRQEKVFFDEKNILETSKAFDFLLGPVLDDTTPGGSGNDPCCGKYPTVELIKGLIADPKQAQMQEFYKQHYGNMYNVALRASQEAKAAEAAGTTTTSPSTDSLKTVKAASKTESEISISPLPSKSDESQKSKKNE